MAGIGHNRGPGMGSSFRAHCWSVARREILGARLPIEVVRLQVDRAKALGLGSIIGYLAAGIAIGPWGLGLVSNVQDILHFAEFGVVHMLFLVGLELQPSGLWAKRRPIFGTGSA